MTRVRSTLAAAAAALLLGGCGGCFKPPQPVGGDPEAPPVSSEKPKNYKVFSETPQATTQPNVLMQKETGKNAQILPPPPPDSR